MVHYRNTREYLFLRVLIAKLFFSCWFEFKTKFSLKSNKLQFYRVHWPLWIYVWTTWNIGGHTVPYLVQRIPFTNFISVCVCVFFFYIVFSLALTTFSFNRKIDSANWLVFLLRFLCVYRPIGSESLHITFKIRVIYYQYRSANTSWHSSS